MSSWKKLNEMLKEERQYRGDSYVPYSELVRLFVGDEKKRGITGSPPDKKGGVATGNYKFDPSVLALGDAKKGDVLAWQDDMESALGRAATDSANQVQSGNPQGGTVHKTNWGGKVGTVSAPIRPNHNDRLGSGYDRYDVVIEADIDWVMNRNGKMVPVGMIKRIAWSPAMGSSQERGDRLQNLMSGRAAPQPLPRRPQADRPVQSKDDEERWAAQAAKRQAADAAASDQHAVATPGDADHGDIKLGGSGGSSNQSFRDKMNKMNRQYEPTGRKANNKAPDEEDSLFWSPEKTRQK